MSETKTPDKAEETEPRTGPVLFFRQVAAELRKVVWPTRERVWTYFLVVLAFVVVMMAFVAGLDTMFGKLVFAVFGRA